MIKSLFYIEANQSTGVCKECSGVILEDALMIRTRKYNKFYYFHLNCYTLKVKKYISKDEIEIWNLDSENERILDLWLEKWNKDWTPADRTDHIIHENKTHDNTAPNNSTPKVYSELPKNRRVWLEVLKFLSPEEMIRSISQVNNYFYLISNNEELWKFYYLKDFGNINSNETHYKNQYIALAAKCCFWLHKIADENNHLLSICPRCGISEINPQALKLKFNIWDRLSKKKYQNKLNPAIEKFNMKKRNLIRMIQKKFKDYSLANFAGKGKCEEFIDLDSVYSLLEIESSFSFREIEIRILIIGDTGLEIILFQSIFW